ncbi:MAG: NifU family protein [Alphaproteobacteria bacterium]|nr:NifU family protein [Alphaproteobacteria bacterium]
MFIQTEATPNPATLKFIPGKPVLSNDTRDYRGAAEAEESPLASRLFQVNGVTGVFFGTDFVTITKDETDWQHLKPAILGVIMEHYLSGAPVVGNGAATAADAAEDFDETDVEIVDTIKDLLDTRVRPAVAQDGGDITFHGYRDGIVHLRMQGACAGCPSSTATLKHGIENLLRHFIPEVEEVRPV